MSILEAVNQARAEARQAIEALYEHSCAIFSYRTRCVEGESVQKPVIAHKNIPCRIVFSPAATNQTTPTNDIGYDAVVILPPDVGVRPGSLLRVTHGGGTATYKQSGEPAVFATHQALTVRRVDKA